MNSQPSLHAQLSELTEARLVRDIDISPDGSMLAVVIQTTDLDNDRSRTALELWDLDHDARLVQTVPDGTRPQWSPHGNTLAYLLPPNDGKSSQLGIWRADQPRLKTVMSLDGVPIGLSWHPDGTQMLLQSRIERTRQEADPWIVREAPFKKDGVGRIWPAHYRLAMLDVNLTTSTPLAEADRIYISPTWSPDGDAVAYAASDEEGTWVAAEAYILTIHDQEVRQLTHRHGTIGWIGWKSRDELVIAGQDEPGPNRLAGLQLIDTCTGTAKNLLHNFDRRVLTSSGSTASTPILVGQTLVFCARDGGSVRLYTVAADGGEPAAWSHGLSVISAVTVAKDRHRFCVVKADITTVNDIFLADRLAGPLRRVSTLNAGIERHVRSQVTELLIDEPSNSPLHGYLLHADNLDKPTPLLVDIHGGPDTAWRPSISPHYWYREVLLRRGWKVLLLNPRGSDGYGEQYMQAAVGNLGFSEEADFLHAIEYLIAAGQVDRTRLAVMGASHGGFMTNWLTGRTDVFSAAVSISCIANWLSLYGTSDSAAAFIEFQMDGTPVDKPERYRDTSPLTYVHQVATATLILHGENDHLNPIGQSEEWFTGLRRLTDLAEIEFARYPNSGHLLIYQSRPSVVLDAMRRIVDWLDRHAGVHSQRQAK